MTKCFAPIISWYQRNFCTQVCLTFLPTVYTSAGSSEQALAPSLVQHSYGTVFYIFNLKDKAEAFIYFCFFMKSPKEQWTYPNSKFYI